MIRSEILHRENFCKFNYNCLCNNLLLDITIYLILLYSQTLESSSFSTFYKARHIREAHTGAGIESTALINVILIICYINYNSIYNFLEKQNLEINIKSFYEHSIVSKYKLYINYISRLYMNFSFSIHILQCI